jgi:hypothetical protein
MDPEDAGALESRPPTKDDLVLLCRSLNEHRVKYILIGGFALIQQGYTRTTEDIDLLLEDSAENERALFSAMEVLPDKAIRQVVPGELRQYVVIRVADEVTVDLMLKACGISYTEALPDVEIHSIEGLAVPVASARLLLRMKQTYREKDAADRLFLEEKLRQQGSV